MFDNDRNLVLQINKGHPKEYNIIYICNFTLLYIYMKYNIDLGQNLECTELISVIKTGQDTPKNH